MSTNELLFPCSYFYFIQFYRNDAAGAYQARRISEVLNPTKKVLGECFGSRRGSIPISSTGTYVSANGGVHGNTGLSLLFVDGHSQFARYRDLIPTSVGFFNFDWTVNGLKGADLAR